MLNERILNTRSNTQNQNAKCNMHNAEQHATCKNPNANTFKMQNAKCRMLNSKWKNGIERSNMQHTEWDIENAKCKVVNAKCKMQNAKWNMQTVLGKCKMQNAKCYIPNAQWKMQSATCKMQDAKCEMQNAKCKKAFPNLFNSWNSQCLKFRKTQFFQIFDGSGINKL